MIVSTKQTAVTRARVLVLACGVLWAAPAIATAAGGPTWSPASTLSQPGLTGLQVHSDVGAGLARTIAIWEDLANGTIDVAVYSGGAWLPALAISDPGDLESLEPRIAVGAMGSAVAIWTGRFWQEGPPRVQQALVKVSTLGPGSTAWGAPVAIGTTDYFLGGSPQVGVSASGTMVAVWRSGSGTIQAATRTAAGAWTAAVDLSSPAAGQASVPRLAVSPLGQAIAVWQVAPTPGTARAIQAAFREPRGTWSDPVYVSTAGVDATSPDVAIDLPGRAVAVWNEGTVVTAASRGWGGHWSTPLALATDMPCSGAPAVAVDLDGSALVSWSALDPSTGQGVVRMVVRSARGAWGPPATLSGADEDASDPHVAASPLGTIQVVGWVDAVTLQARVATRIGRGAWTSPTSLGTAISGGIPDTQVQVAANPLFGAAAVWTSPIGFEGVSVVQGAILAP